MSLFARVKHQRRSLVKEEQSKVNFHSQGICMHFEAHTAVLVDLLIAPS